MIGIVLGSRGMPVAPWHALQTCTLGSMSAGCADAALTAKTVATAPKIVENRCLDMAYACLPVPDADKYPHKAWGRNSKAYCAVAAGKTGTNGKDQRQGSTA